MSAGPGPGGPGPGASVWSGCFVESKFARVWICSINKSLDCCWWLMKHEAEMWKPNMAEWCGR